jgi:hypothetical protein
MAWNNRSDEGRGDEGASGLVGKNNINTLQARQRKRAMMTAVATPDYSAAKTL